jgi:hypothetical protein
MQYAVIFALFLTGVTVLAAAGCTSMGLSKKSPDSTQSSSTYKPYGSISNNGAKSSSQNKQTEKSSWLTSMFQSKEPEQQPTTTEWVGGKRPGF